MKTEDKDFKRLFDSLKGAGYIEKDIYRIKRCIESDEGGLILVTGVSGSGKTTTMSYMLKTKVESDKSMNFSIFDNLSIVNDIRDYETSHSAIKSVMEGVNLYATMYSKDIFDLSELLKYSDVYKNELASDKLVKCILHQRVFNKLCRNCSLKIKDDSIFNKFKNYFVISSSSGGIMKRGAGCKRCKNGISGKIYISEALFPDVNIMNMIANLEKSEAEKYWIDSLDGESFKTRYDEYVLSGDIEPFI